MSSKNSERGNFITFVNLHADGTQFPVKRLSRQTVLSCPHTILVPEHYRADGTCKCDDPDNAVMGEWGYKWKDGMWR